MWSIAIATIGVFYAAFYPLMRNPDMQAVLDAYPPELLDALGFTDITSPAGYVGSTTYGILGPILMIIFAGSLGVRAIAGEEEEGRLDVLLAHPVERWQVVVQRAAATAVALVLAGAILFVAMLAVSGPAEIAEIGPTNLAAASVQIVLLGLFFGSLGLAAGALTGSRGIAWGAVALVGVASYFANTLGPSVDWLEWSQQLSPFHWFSGGAPLRNGWQPGDAALLLGTSLVLVAIAVVGFRRRDVAV
jgi:ABC-2 type transport system permease protein